MFILVERTRTGEPSFSFKLNIFCFRHCVFLLLIFIRTSQIFFRYFSDRNFAGGMKLVSLSSIVENKPIRRNLDDKNVTMQSKGVLFDECLKVVRGNVLHFILFVNQFTKSVDHCNHHF